MSDPAALAREHVLDAHAETVEAVLNCADAVAAEWDGDAATSRRDVAPPLRDALTAAGVLARLPDVLAGVVEAAGFSLPATPVAGPPYVAVTSEGPLLRATVSAGRLVVAFEVFAVERGGNVGPPRYVRAARTQDAAVRARLR
ncbi:MULTISPECIES: hypothetical protein [Halorussus]|uniref:hypothetical protein n=1 Tax=Halorussus TaxID=1070314 RepID=UPI00209D1DDA|nr:hypothetical protein [Halorussus vallis]USZ77896.1 hypothetical protein NGM07_22210 [Halorussus vallis]